MYIEVTEDLFQVLYQNCSKSECSGKYIEVAKDSSQNPYQNCDKTIAVSTCKLQKIHPKFPIKIVAKEINYSSKYIVAEDSSQNPYQICDKTYYGMYIEVTKDLFQVPYQKLQQT